MTHTTQKNTKEKSLIDTFRNVAKYKPFKAATTIGAHLARERRNILFKALKQAREKALEEAFYDLWGDYDVSTHGEGIASVIALQENVDRIQASLSGVLL